MAIVTNDKNLVKEFVKINFINSLSSFPNWEVAEERYLLPLIGQAMYDKLAAIIADDAANDQDKELVKKAQAVVIPLAYLIELAVNQTQLTDAGLRTISTENMQAAHRWEYNQVKEYFEDLGAYAIEAFLKFLFKHKADYAEWTDSDEYKEASSLIFTTGEEFNRYFRTAQPQRLFWQLKPLIKEVEDFYIVPLIGEDFLIELKENDAPGDEEKKVIDLIKKTVAQYTVIKAIEKQSAQITTQGFTVKVTGSYIDDAGAGNDNAPDSRLSLLYGSCERSGDSYSLQLKEYLNKNASAQLFATFFGSEYYEAPTTETTNPNDNRIGIIGF